MSYKYNHSIQFDLDHLTQCEDVSDLEEKKMELDEVYRKSEAFDKILHQVDKESNWTTVETPLGTTKVLLHTRIGIYTHGVIKRMRNKDDKSLEDKLSELKSDYRIYDQEELR